jgi:hypothetical protein
MIRNLIAVLALGSSAFTFVSPGAALQCPENANLIDTVVSGNVTTRVCKCRDGYNPKGGKCVAKPGVIDPRWLAMSGQADRIDVRLKALAVQRAFIERQMDELRTIEGGLDQLWQDNRVATLTLLHDAQSQTLDVLDGLLSMSGMPPGVGRAAGSYLSFAQAYFYQYAYASTADEQRAREKMIDAIGALKNLVTSSSWGIRGAEAESIKAATDGVLKIYKIVDRQRRSGSARFSRADLEDAHGALVDTIQAASRVGPPLKVATGQANLTLGVPFALRRLELDARELSAARQANRTALRFYDNRLALIEQDEALLREGLRLERQRR